MGGGHNTHASGISKRAGTESNSRASRGKSTDGFSSSGVVLAGLTDITTYTRTATPKEEELIAVRKGGARRSRVARGRLRVRASQLDRADPPIPRRPFSPRRASSAR